MGQLERVIGGHCSQVVITRSFFCSRSGGREESGTSNGNRTWDIRIRQCLVRVRGADVTTTVGRWRLAHWLLCAVCLLPTGCAEQQTKTTVNGRSEDVKALRSQQGGSTPGSREAAGNEGQAVRDIGIPVYPGARLVPARSLGTRESGPLQGVTSVEYVSTSRRAAVIGWYRSKFPGTLTAESPVQTDRPLSIVQADEAKNLVKIVNIGGKDGAVEIKLLRAKSGDLPRRSGLSQQPKASPKSTLTAWPEVKENTQTALNQIRLPLYPGAKPVSGTVTSMGSDSPVTQTTVLLQSSDPSDSVAQWYRQQLASAEMSEQTVAAGKIVSFNIKEASSNNCIISVMGNKEKTNITLMRIDVSKDKMKTL